MTGLLVGDAVVIWLTFGGVCSGHIDVGLIALVPNIVIVTAGALRTKSRPADDRAGTTAAAQTPGTARAGS